jgi:hypothetical protein
MNKKVLGLAIITACIIPSVALAGINEGSYNIDQNGKSVAHGNLIVKKNTKNESFKIKIINNKTHKIIGSASGTTLGGNPLLFDVTREIPFTTSSTTSNKTQKLKQGYVESGYNFTVITKGATVHVIGTISKLNKMKKINSGTNTVDAPSVNSVNFNQSLLMHNGQTVKLRNGIYLISLTRKT